MKRRREYPRPYRSQGQILDRKKKEKNVSMYHADKRAFQYRKPNLSL